MEFRYFQIIVPFLALLLILRQINEYRKDKSGTFEVILISVFWICTALVAIFPDLISELIADIFGIKDNVNAIIFFALGLLFYFQFQLYRILKRQDEYLTELTRKIAIENSKKNATETDQ